VSSRSIEEAYGSGDPASAAGRRPAAAGSYRTPATLLAEPLPARA
jgi:hypothetical protein